MSNAFPSLVFPPAEPDFAAAAQDWLRFIASERRLSPLSLDAYARDLRQFVRFLADYQGEAPSLATIDALAAADVRAFMAWRRQNGVGSRTLLRQLAGLRSFARFCERQGVAKTAALGAVRSPKLPRTLPRAISPKLARAVAGGDGFAGEARPPWIAARDTAVLALLYGSGLRISEALGILRRDAPVGGFDAVTVIGKGAKMRQVPVIEPVAQAVER